MAMTASGCNDHRHADGYDLPDHFIEVGEACTQDIQCVIDSVCFAGTCVGEGQLRVSLAWDRRTDADLHVRTPSGFEISYLQPDHATGHLDVDDCILVCKSWNGPHVENVFFEDNAEHGTYEVWVVNFDGRRSTDFEIEVDGEGVGHNWDGHLPGNSGHQSTHWTFEYDPD